VQIFVVKLNNGNNSVNRPPATWLGKYPDQKPDYHLERP